MRWNDRWSITAATKLRKSVGGPIATLASCSSSVERTTGHSDFGTYARDAAEHFWPWYSKAPRTSAVTSSGTLAEGWTNTKFLPPVSPTTRG